MNKGWHAEQIKAEIRVRSRTLRKFAKRHKLAASLVTKVLKGSRSRHVETVISNALGVPAHELWPDRWTPDGCRIDRRCRGAA